MAEEVEYKNHLLKVGNKYYKLASHDGVTHLEEVSDKDVKRKLQLVNELASRLKDNLDREIIMREALVNIRLKELEKLDKMVKSKRNYKPRTREGACADMKVGKFIIPIVN